MSITIQYENLFAQLPLDSGQYIYEALNSFDLDSDYAPGVPDDKMTRRYNLLFLMAIKNVFSKRSVEAFRKKFVPTDEANGYGPLPIDFLTTYQFIYDLRIEEVNGVTQLCGRADQTIEYISIPNAIGALPYLCQDAIKKRFLYECKGINEKFNSLLPLITADLSEAMAAWITYADHYNKLYSRSNCNNYYGS